MITPFLGQTHVYTNISKKLGLLLACTAVTLSAFSQPALAFEMPLSISEGSALIAQLTPSTTYDAPVPTALPTQDFTSHAVVAVASPVTQEGNWPTPKPAVVTRRALADRPRPTLENPIVLEGEASYYSWAGCLGCNPLRVMANGQQLNDNALTMAIGADKKHLVGYQARVTNLATGTSVVVRITDTGGFYQAKYGNRVADLTIATKEAIGMRGGLGQVRVEVF